jgi:hypothetical protein
MVWYTLIILFFAGAFLANSIPHYVSGVLGRKFPTPFAHPPGRGLSSPIVNMLWGFLNFIVAYALFFISGPIKLEFNFDILAILIGAFIASYISAKNFGKLNL